jgi:hypothetical protein
MPGFDIKRMTNIGLIAMKMFKELHSDQARFIAILARTARAQRDALLGKAAGGDLGQPNAARGEHNPAAALGFEPLSPNAPQVAALDEAIAGLSNTARRELYALMRIGQGQLAAKKLHRGVSDAELLGDDIITAALMEDADLHDHIVKGLYETDMSD